MNDNYIVFKIGDKVVRKKNSRTLETGIIVSIHDNLRAQVQWSYVNDQNIWIIDRYLKLESIKDLEHRDKSPLPDVLYIKEGYLIKEN